ncbi:MAG TPA: S41 family peptidase [Pyrinomonadaceae bacterium]|jgi:hypothetical protein
MRIWTQLTFSVIQTKTLLFLIILFTCSAFAQSAFDVNQRLTPEQLIEDVDFYIKTLEEAHANPYAHVSAKEFQARANQIKSRIHERGAMTQKEFWLLFTPLASLIQDSHTFVVDPRFFIKGENDTTKYFPIRTVYVDGKIVVEKSFASENVEKGSVITAINGISSREIIRRLSEYRSGVERERVENAVQWLWVGAAEVFGRPDEFAVSFAEGSKIQVKGLNLPEFIKRENAARAANRASATKNDSPLELKLLDNGIAYLNSTTFDYDLEKYKTLLKDVFTQIKSAGVKKLIIDVRSNGGGDSKLGDALIDMFNAKPYKHFSMKWKRSNQYVEYLKSKNLPVADIYQSKRPGEFVSTNSEIKKPGANPLRFDGQVYVLSSKHTFSSAQMFLAVIKDNKLAKVIGEETNEPACSYGEVYAFSLPHSRLRTTASVKYWVPPTGCKNASGVIPDLPVTRRVADYVNGRDAILETALSLIKKES